MPSFQIHLAIAKRYIGKHKITNVDDFIEGSIAPDLVRPKTKSHYTTETASRSLLEAMNNKVNLERYLKENEIKTDYDKGILLHLVADKIFFTEFFDREMVKKTNCQEFTENLYTSYDKTNEYLSEKYPMIIKEELQKKMQFDIEKSKKEKKLSSREGKQILPLENLDTFIEEISNIDLEEYIVKE